MLENREGYMNLIITIPIEAYKELMQRDRWYSMEPQLCGESFASFIKCGKLLTDYISDIHEIPEFYHYDTETSEFYVYRHRYTGKEIHILKEPETYRLLPDCPMPDDI